MILSWDEWSPLKKIIVGDATDANWPVLDPVFAKESEKTTWKETPVPRGPVPQRIIEEANQDLDDLATTLQNLGVEVVRPDPMNFQTHDGMYNYCPRDRLLVYGNTIVDPAMMYPCRDMELQCYHDVVDSAEYYHFMPRNEGMILDAANVLRCNDDLFYLVSNTGNKKGAEYLQELVGPDKRVHAIENVYSYIHLDSTIALLREGLMLLNPARIKNVDQLPEVLRNWDIIWAAEPYDIGHYPGYCNASKWVSVNLLSINPNLVVLEEHQRDLAIELKKHGIDSAMLPMRHARTLGGCFHCVTLDLMRYSGV